VNDEGTDHPLQVLEGGVEVFADAGQGDVHDVMSNSNMNVAKVTDARVHHFRAIA